jgi:hypothetical protein
MRGKKTKELLIFIRNTGLLLPGAMTLKSLKLIQTQTTRCSSGCFENIGNIFLRVTVYNWFTFEIKPHDISPVESNLSKFVKITKLNQRKKFNCFKQNL